MELFRLGVGAIVLNKEKKILAFQRTDFQTDWQGPEGGLENNENALNGLARELKEEIGLEKNQFNILKETKEFFPYLFPKNVKKSFFSKVVGQKKKFFLIQLNENFTRFKYDTLKDEIEFRDVKVVTAVDLIKSVPEFKKNLYIKVLNEFGLL